MADAFTPRRVTPLATSFSELTHRGLEFNSHANAVEATTASQVLVLCREGMVTFALVFPRELVDFSPIPEPFRRSRPTCATCLRDLTVAYTPAALQEERMRDLLNKGKGSHYSAKRRHATTKDIEEFGFVSKPAGASSSQTAPATTTTTIAPLAENKRPPGWGSKTIPTQKPVAEEEGKARRRWWRFW